MFYESVFERKRGKEWKNDEKENDCCRNPDFGGMLFCRDVFLLSAKKGQECGYKAKRR